jgi:hypothetical protein
VQSYRRGWGADVVGQPSWCLRSDHDYPSIVAEETGATQFRDVSSSGATTST